MCGNFFPCLQLKTPPILPCDQMFTQMFTNSRCGQQHHKVNRASNEQNMELTRLSQIYPITFPPLPLPSRPQRSSWRAPEVPEETGKQQSAPVLLTDCWSCFEMSVFCSFSRSFKCCCEESRCKAEINRTRKTPIQSSEAISDSAILFGIDRSEISVTMALFS